MTRQQPRPSPYRWLWDEIARRFGDDAAQLLKSDFDEQSRAYQHEKWHTPESPWQPRAKPPPKRGKR